MLLCHRSRIYSTFTHSSPAHETHNPYSCNCHNKEHNVALNRETTQTHLWYLHLSLSPMLGIRRSPMMWSFTSQPIWRYHGREEYAHPKTLCGMRPVTLLMIAGGLGWLTEFTHAVRNWLCNVEQLHDGRIAVTIRSIDMCDQVCSRS